MTKDYQLLWGPKIAAQLTNLKSIFIIAPRELSNQRFIELIKHYLPKANIVLGIAEEDYIVGFEGQPQFKTLRLNTVESTIKSVANSASTNKIFALQYSQTDLATILEAVDFSRVIAINGSWKYAFHHSSAHKVLTQKKTPLKYVSPFKDETEAKQYLATVSTQIYQPTPKPTNSELEMLGYADQFAKQSFDYSFQTGVVLARKADANYKFLASGVNRVVPYQTYALHHGASRETNFSPHNDANHYDTIHAEMDLLVSALKQGINLQGTTLFINLLPCPNCARTLSQTDISEFVYSIDHSNGYAVKMLEDVGKKVRKAVQ